MKRFVEAKNAMIFSFLLVANAMYQHASVCMSVAHIQYCTRMNQKR